MITDFYSIFNAGNPESIFRFIIKDPGYDITVTLILSVFIILIAVKFLTDKQQDPIFEMLEKNKEYINKLREKGKSNGDIADSFLKEIGIKKGFSYPSAQRKVLRYLNKL